jgi:excisionase family DNA binding protein
MFDFPQSHRSYESLLDSEQAAALIQVHPKTLQRYARNGIVTGVRVGKLWRFRASDLLPSRSECVQESLDEKAPAQ